ncbi:MAG: alanine:cation symporter family protein [Ruminococcaceae bacterium]|nr:alanine:cation symporter family protein [Oscillospiraceae bacterium]
MIEKLTDIIDFTNDALYSYVLIILLVLGGIYFMIRTRFAQFRLLGQQFKSVTEKSDKNGVSSFQALMVSTASRVGTGNIIGVATALCMGGFGSVFWMWVIALIGAASAFVESTLAQIYKKKGIDGCYGGPAYYIEAATKRKGLAIIFSIFLVLTYGVGFNMLASYNLQSTFSSYSFYDARYTPWIIGLVIAVLVGYCLIGGGKRLVSVTSFLVPIMGAIYILMAIAISVINIKVLPDVFKQIFVGAFDFNAIFGGFSGSCIMYGIKRGLFSNEAGVGSAPNASASADVSHPAKQGLVQVLSVFIDTILVCSATAFMCMSSGVTPPADSNQAASYVQASLAATLGNIGPIFITVAMILFAFTTLLGNLFYVDKTINYLLGKEPTKLVRNIYYIIASLVIFVGAGLSADLLWGVADIMMGGMTLINMPIIIYLGKYAIRTLKDYEMKLKKGGDITFHKNDIDLPHETDYWN